MVFASAGGGADTATADGSVPATPGTSVAADPGTRRGTGTALAWSWPTAKPDVVPAGGIAWGMALGAGGVGVVTGIERATWPVRPSTRGDRRRPHGRSERGERHPDHERRGRHHRTEPCTHLERPSALWMNSSVVSTGAPTVTTPCEVPVKSRETFGAPESTRRQHRSAPPTARSESSPETGSFLGGMAPLDEIGAVPGAVGWRHSPPGPPTLRPFKADITGWLGSSTTPRWVAALSASSGKRWTGCGEAATIRGRHPRYV